MRKSTVFIAVCAGAPLLVLGVGAPTAAAKPSTDSGNANVSVSVNGNTVVQKGLSVAISDPGHNTAVAVNSDGTRYGADYDAQAAAGTHNHAVAVNGATAYAYSGDSNMPWQPALTLTRRQFSGATTRRLQTIRLDCLVRRQPESKETTTWPSRTTEALHRRTDRTTPPSRQTGVTRRCRTAASKPSGATETPARYRPSHRLPRRRGNLQRYGNGDSCSAMT